MYSLSKALIYGFLVWLIPFIVAFLVFSLHEDNRPLFESIMAVAVTVTVVVLAILYFRNVAANHLREGVYLGVIWFVISVVIDLVMFMYGPDEMRMTFGEYMSDIGVTYLIMPAITVGFGYVLETVRAVVTD